jgi:hypothetical protein
MRTLPPALVLTAQLLLPGVAAAGGNVVFLVRAFRPCPGPAICTAAPDSSFTFDTAVLKTSRARYTKGGKVAVTVEIKGVRDAGGALVTTDANDPSDDFRLVIPESQVTVPGIGTLPPGVAGGDVVVPFDLRNGIGRQPYPTPAAADSQPGLVAESTGLPVIFDNQGRRLAVSGSQVRP